MDKDELARILDEHKKWATGGVGGKRAYLRDADLRGAKVMRPQRDSIAESLGIIVTD